MPRPDRSHPRLDLDHLRWLAELGVDLDVPMDNGMLPLQAAVSVGDLDLVARLLERGASVDAAVREPFGVLTVAMGRGLFGLVPVLIERLTEPATVHYHGRSLLRWMVYWREVARQNEESPRGECALDAARLLLARGCDPVEASDTGMSLPELAAYHGDWEMEALLRAASG